MNESNRTLPLTKIVLVMAGALAGSVLTSAGAFKGAEIVSTARADGRGGAGGPTSCSRWETSSFPQDGPTDIPAGYEPFAAAPTPSYGYVVFARRCVAP